MSLLTNLKTEFIHFIEANQCDNINKLSGWHLRLQNLYLAQANMTEHTLENRHTKTTSRTNVPDKG